MKKNFKSKAFSLIELSIVVLIIGILIAGVTQGSRLIRQSRLKTAQSQTISSPVLSITGLVGWWESTMDNSIISVNNGFFPENNDLISNWNDINSQSIAKNTTSTNSSCTPTTCQPTYIANGMNGLPVARFSGNQYVLFDGSILVGTDYTIFVVEQRSSAANFNYFICGSGGTNQNLHIGYGNPSTNIVFNQYFNDYYVSSAVPSYSSLIPRIHGFVFNVSNGKKYYLNGQLQTLTPVGSPVGTQGLIGYPGAAIGCNPAIGGGPFVGDIGELIIYSRTLKNEERRSIENYLSGKWKIGVS